MTKGNKSGWSCLKNSNPQWWKGRGAIFSNVQQVANERQKQFGGQPYRESAQLKTVKGLIGFASSLISKDVS